MTVKRLLNNKELKKMKKKEKSEKIKNIDNLEKIQKKIIKEQRKKYKKPIRKVSKNKKALEKDSDINRKIRLKRGIILVGLLGISFIIRIGYIQLIWGEELQAMAYIQQTLDRSINPKRGTIYDTTRTNILAVSSTVYTVTVVPNNIEENDKEKIATALTNIFELDYETVLKKVNKNSSIEIIVKKVEKEETDKLRLWMSQNNILTGINIDEDTKRFYPYNNLASQIIGFCGYDNQGLDGIEAIYEDILQGETGSILKMTDATGSDMKNTSEEYIEAINGDDIVLSIDLTIQSIAEKYLEEACIDNVCTDGGNVIIMDPNTGDILAMAGYPNYNLNEPFEPSTDELKEVWDTLSQSQQTTTLQQLWRNKAVTDAYEPGSTFKLVTAAIALEEGFTQTDMENEFNCTRKHNYCRSYNKMLEII